ncbi:hypothetical protein [Pseudoalteromonas ruthenica]|uniref:hypothetical protein n=1 Tax=Pseudoalteromonas ruthenica TaxID=151081 RepID=UPI0011099005|nr:hypothetical protein [Pseudoalteromonas ruthenica]
MTSLFDTYYSLMDGDIRSQSTSVATMMVAAQQRAMDGVSAHSSNKKAANAANRRHSDDAAKGYFCSTKAMDSGATKA